MAEPTDNLTAAAQKTWKRRGLFAAAAALVAGVVARVSEQPVEAGTDGDVVLGAGNTETAQTSITNTTASSTALQVINNVGFDGWGLDAYGSGYGVIGRSNTPGTQPGGAGVYGETSRPDSYGVWGFTAPGVGVRGESSSGTGVFGLSSSGAGVFGNIPASSSANTIAIYGVNASAYTGSVPGTGGWGVVGVSRYGHGVLGATSALGAGAVVGNNYGITGAWAGIFFGPTIVEGAFTVIGAKSAAVPHPDGSHRRLYCLESPESWFEDFGKGQLACGQADVTIDPDFAAVVNLEDYHVFLTGYGDHELTITEQTARGFRVESKNAASTNRFSWRVVAKRKDIAAPRFETVTIPPAPLMPSVPEPPSVQAPPALEKRSARPRG